MQFSKEKRLAYQDPVQGFGPGQFPSGNPSGNPGGNLAENPAFGNSSSGNPASANPPMPAPKDPKAAALMSGDIDQVFTAFGFEGGFLNRKKFLAQHPEIIEYINSKIGQQRIGYEAEGYKGTSEENGAYISYFKDNAGRMESLKVGSNGPVPPVPHAVSQIPPTPYVPSAPPASQPTDFGPPADFSQTASSPAISAQPTDIPIQEPVISKRIDSVQPPKPELEPEPEPEPELQSPATYSPPQVQPAYSSAENLQGSADYSLSGTNVKDGEDEEAIGIFHEDSAKDAPEPFEETKRLDIGDEVELIEPDAAQPEFADKSLADKSGENTEKIQSLANLENLDWWPADDIILDIRDDRHAIMEIVTGSGLVKRSVTWNLSRLENGNFWIFTTDITVPSNERDQILDMEEFKEMIENSY